MPLDDSILGQGVYTPREAARLVGTTPQHVLRWTRGSGPNEPLWQAHYQFLDEGVTEISFLDLIEVRVVSALRRNGVSLQSIRFAISFAQSKLRVERPLASRTFKTDGSEILMEALEGDGEFVSLKKGRAGQKVFSKIIAQSVNDLEYDGDVASRWRPHGHPEVIIDPKRRFGDPTLDALGVSTAALYQDFQEFGDLNYIASIYEIPKQSVRAGVNYERSLDEADG